MPVRVIMVGSCQTAARRVSVRIGASTVRGPKKFPMRQAKLGVHFHPPKISPLPALLDPGSRILLPLASVKGSVIRGAVSPPGQLGSQRHSTGP